MLPLVRNRNRGVQIRSESNDLSYFYDLLHFEFFGIYLESIYGYRAFVSKVNNKKLNKIYTAAKFWTFIFFKVFTAFYLFIIFLCVHLFSLLDSSGGGDPKFTLPETNRVVFPFFCDIISHNIFNCYHINFVNLF